REPRHDEPQEIEIEGSATAEVHRALRRARTGELERRGSALEREIAQRERGAVLVVVPRALGFESVALPLRFESRDLRHDVDGRRMVAEGAVHRDAAPCP